MPNVLSSDARDTPTGDAAPEVFGWLCDNALHELGARHGAWERLSSLSEAETLLAWQLVWLALDLASAPANNLPEIAGQAEAEVVSSAVQAEPAIPKLSAAGWQELRHARELQLFAKPLTRTSAPNQVRPRSVLALELRAVFAALQHTELVRWVTPELVEQLEHMLSASLWTVAAAGDAPTPLLPAVAMRRMVRHLRASREEQSTRAPMQRRFDHAASASEYLSEETSRPNWAPCPPVPEAVRRGDEVQFTVFRPNQLAPERWSKLLAFAHLAQRRPDAPPGSPDPIALVQEQAQALLGSDMPKYRQLSEDAGQPIPFEGQLTFMPEVSGVKFDPPRASILWVDDVQRVEFRMRPSAQLAGSTARGRLSVFCGSILVAELQLSLRVAASHDSESQTLAPPESARMYRKIFASYSHKDANIVEQFRELAKAFGDRYLIDVSDLRAGESWSEALEQLIREADVFQLFWSWSSMRSEFVRREWEYALQLGRTSFVRPTYWEQPMPSVPSEGLPPPHLASLHFHALSLASASQPPTAATPAPGPGVPPPASAPMAADDYIGPRDDPGITLEDRANPDHANASRTWLRRVVPASSAVALGAALLFVLNTVNVLGPPTTPPAATIEVPEPKPANTTDGPVPPVPIANPTPAPETVDKPALQPEIDPRAQPVPNSGPQPRHPIAKPTTTPKRPPTAAPVVRTRFANVAAAKSAFEAKEIDEAEYGKALKELEAARVQRRQQEGLKLKSGKLSKGDYERSLDAIDSDLGFLR